ncbi:MAG: GNAT family N-acetyltransferase [Bdellovibrionales bacterium]|nr:GNAT family N-acetyltransferase [Bdellovibrionales bacterium]
MQTAKKLKPLMPDIQNREIKRLEIRRGDGLEANAKINENSSYKVSIFDLNPFGACISINPEMAASLTKDEKIEITILLPDKLSITYLAIIKWIRTEKNSIKAGLEFIEQFEPYPSSIPIAEESYFFKVPEDFQITAFYYKHYMFLERGTAKITGISEKMWKVELRDSESIIYKSQIIKLWFLGFEKPVDAEVISIDKTENSKVELQCLIREIPGDISLWISKQLIFVCELSPLDIRKLGFNISKVSNGFRFRFVKTQNEYEEVLKLRFKAYLYAGKVDASKSYIDMVAPLDDKSRILVCYHGTRVVASVSISFPSSEQDILDTERAFPNGYPSPIPSKKTVVEIARLCTDPEYRRTDLLNRVFEYTYKATICGDREYIITSTDKKLWALYKKLGFKKTGMKYLHPYLSGIEHDIIIGRRGQPDFAEHISPLAWNYLWRDMNDFMTKRGFITLSLLQRVRINIYKFIGKLLRIQMDREY